MPSFCKEELRPRQALCVLPSIRGYRGAQSPCMAECFLHLYVLCCVVLTELRAKRSPPSSALDSTFRAKACRVAGQLGGLAGEGDIKCWRLELNLGLIK